MAGHSDIAVFAVQSELKCMCIQVLKSRAGVSKVNRKLQLQHLGWFQNEFTCMITSKLLLYEDCYSHRMWPQHKTGQILHYRALLVLSSFLLHVFFLIFFLRISAPLPHKWQVCAERLFTRDSFYAHFFFHTTSRTTDRCTLAPCLSPTHIHTHTLKCRVCVCLSVGEVRGPRGTNSRSALWGRGEVVNLLESRRGILCETETSRLTETAHSCTAAAPQTSCTHCLFKPIFSVFKPIFLCCQSLALPPAESACSSGHWRQQGTDVILLRQYLQTSILFFYR